MTRVALAVLLLSACGSSTLERVPIPPGSSVRSAADSLAAHHVIWSRPFFRLVARWTHLQQRMHAGVYEFRRSTTTPQLIRAIARGDALHFRITVTPGSTIFDFARNVQRRLAIPAESTIAAARDSTLRTRFHIDGPSVEGWLLPQSFDFNGFDTPSQLLARFIVARVQAWDTSWDARAHAAHLDRQGVMVLASIVEAEARDPAERPLIAAVYRNRLRDHMALQADPTVQYAYLLQTGARKGRLFDVDYRYPSPWNTYLHSGLPPGPVGNPSRAAIEAVLEPAKVPYRYFVAGPDGKSVFATTYAEHLRNIKRLREQM